MEDQGSRCSKGQPLKGGEGLPFARVFARTLPLLLALLLTGCFGGSQGGTSFPPGTFWFEDTPFTGDNIWDVEWCSDSGLFITVTDSGGDTTSHIYTAGSGLFWFNSHNQAGRSLYGATCRGSAAVAVGEGGIVLTSANGLLWFPLGDITVLDLFSVASSSTLYAAVGATGVLATSPDGVSWTGRSSGTTADLYRIIWDDTLNLFVAVGAFGVITTSPDGITWTVRSSTTLADLFGIARSGNSLIAVGESGTILISPDGINWSAPPGGTFTGSDILSVAALSTSQGVTTAVVGTGGLIYYTTEDVATGPTWVDAIVTTSQNILDVAASPGRFVGVGGAGTVVSTY